MLRHSLQKRLPVLSKEPFFAAIRQDDIEIMARFVVVVHFVHFDCFVIAIIPLSFAVVHNCFSAAAPFAIVGDDLVIATAANVAEL